MDTGSNKQDGQWQLKGEEDSFTDYMDEIIKDEYTTDYEPKKPASLKYIIIPILAILVFIGLMFLINLKARLGFIDRKNIPAIDDLDGKKTENHFNVKDQRYVTIVVYGIDAHDITTSNTRSDSIVAVVIDKEEKKINTVSVARDSYVYIENDEDKDMNESCAKINSAYSKGGVELAIKTIYNNYDIKADYFVTVNFFSFQYITDWIGGVEADVNTKELMKSVNRYGKEVADDLGTTYNPVTETGVQTLDGCQLLGYVRTRKIDNDFYRMERLQIIMRNMFDKLKKKNTFDLIVKNDENLKGLLKNVYTNMSDNEIISLIKIVKESTIDETLTVPINYETRKISTGDTVFSSDYEEDVRKIHEILYNDDTYELTDNALEMANIHNMYLGK